MSQFFGIIIAAALVNNLVLVQLLGVSALFSYSNNLRNAIELAWVSGSIMFASAVINLLVGRWLLVPLQLEFLQLILFVVVSASLAQLLFSQLAPRLPHSFRRLGLEFYLISGNSAIVGLSLLNMTSVRSIPDSITYSLGAAIGFGLLLVMFAALRERLDTADIPAPLRGAPIHLISAGIVAMCLLGFAGLV